MKVGMAPQKLQGPCRVCRRNKDVLCDRWKSSEEGVWLSFTSPVGGGKGLQVPVVSFGGPGQPGLATDKWGGGQQQEGSGGESG